MNLDDIKSRVSIVDLAQHLGIQCDSHHKALCPFHNDKNPSLSFKGQQFHCFGCNASGDIFTLVMLKNGLSFSEAVKFICNLYHIENYNIKKDAIQSSKEYGLDLAYKLYQQEKQPEKLEKWSHKRAIPTEFLKSLGILYLKGNVLTSSSHTPFQRSEIEGLIAAGVLYKKTYGADKNNQLYLDLPYTPGDFFNYPGILFPIKDSSGELSGFAYRCEDTDVKNPKYKYNYSFVKSSNFYGLDLVFQKIEEFKKLNRGDSSEDFNIFIVEGLMDAVRLQSFGLNALAILGSSLAVIDKDKKTKQSQLEIIQFILEKLKNFQVKIHVFLDNDGAGIRGARKVFWPLLETANTYPNLQFDYIFFEQESGKDPDEICQDFLSENIYHELTSHIYAPADFIVATELHLSPENLNKGWDSCQIWDKRNAISRICKEAPLNRNWSYDVLLYSGIQNNKETNSSASQYLINELRRSAQKSTYISDWSLEEHTDIRWRDAVQKAWESYATSDFPMDLGSWDRCYRGINTLKHILHEALKSAKPLEPYSVALIPRSPGEMPRLLTLPSQEDLILETAVLLEIFQYAVTHPGRIPIVFDDGSKATTFCIDSNAENTVSFAYQVNCKTVSYSGFDSIESGVFKHFSECWKDYNDFILEKARVLLKDNSEAFTCIRLDIHRYYDSISKIEIKRLLESIFTPELIREMEKSSPAIQCIANNGNDTASANVINWIINRSFAYQYYAPFNSDIDSAQTVDTPEKGIPQGPNLSAWLANILLFDLDNKVKQRCKEINDKAKEEGLIDDGDEISWYARYVDDMIIAAPSKDEADQLKRLIQNELEQMDLFLSLKIDEEYISSKQELFDLIKKNRGLKQSPYGGESVGYEDFDCQNLEWNALNGHIDRKNLLSYLYSVEALNHAFDSESKKLCTMLQELLFNTDEIRYRDYRRVFTLLIFSIFRNDKNTDDCISELFNDIKHLNIFIDNTSIADSPDSWENIYSCWQLFSIFEAIQNILVKRYDLNPYFSEDLCKNIFNIRKHLIDEILNNNILEKLVKEFFNKSSGLQLRFKAMISTWDTALKANAYFQRSEENHVEKIELSLRNLRLGLSLPHDSIPTFSSEQIKKCPFLGAILTFHCIVGNFLVGKDISWREFDSYKNDSTFQCLFPLFPNSENSDSLLKSSEYQFDALSTFANSVPPEKQFDFLKIRTHLLCESLSAVDQQQIKLVASPNDDENRFIIAFIHNSNHITEIKVITPKDQYPSGTIKKYLYPLDIWDGISNKTEPICHLDIYSADVATLDIHLLNNDEKVLSSQEKIKRIQEYYQSIYDGIEKHFLDRLIFSCNNLVFIKGKITPVAWQSEKEEYSYAVNHAEQPVSIPDNTRCIVKAGFAAYEAANNKIIQHQNILEKMHLVRDFDYESPAWIFDFLLRHLKYIFLCSSIPETLKNALQIQTQKIDRFWVATDKLLSTDSAKTRVALFFSYRFIELVWQIDSNKRRKNNDSENSGYGGEVLYDVACKIFPSGMNFYDYVCHTLSNINYTFTFPTKRKNINAWYALGILIAQSFDNEDCPERQAISLSLKFYALITWIKDLCYECIESSKINYDNVSTKIVQFGLDQGKWCLTDSKGQITSRLKQLITIFCSPVPSPITPLGYCCIACAVLSSDSSSLDKILSFFAELNSNRLGDAECIDFLNSLADKLQNIDDVFSELSKLEANEGIIVYENQGYNPTTGKVLTIEKREYNLPREKIHFSSLGYGDDQIAKHQEQDSNIYKWSETWHKGKIEVENRLIGVSCISERLDAYVTFIEDKRRYGIEQEVVAVNSDVPQQAKAKKIESESKTPVDVKEIPSQVSLESNILGKIRRLQETIWAQHQKENDYLISDQIRIAFLQFDIGCSSYFKCDVKKDTEENNPKDNKSIFIKDELVSYQEKRRTQLHTKTILSRALDLCNLYGVELLLLPEYSVFPDDIEFMINKLNGCNTIVWAGTFRRFDGNADKLLQTCKGYTADPYANLASTLCIVTKDGVKFYRDKKYPAIAGKEDFSPWTGVLKPLYQTEKIPLHDSGSFISELICAEIFMVTSPANIGSLTMYHKLLMDKYRPLQPIKDRDKYYKDLIWRDLKSFANEVGYIYEKGTENKAPLEMTRRKARRSVLFIPAMTTRADDFHILGQTNFLAASLCSVFCNGVSSTLSYDIAPHGGSCFIGFDSTVKNPTIPHTPYSGFAPGIFATYGTALDTQEEALVIADVDPFFMSEGKPRPQTLPTPLNLVAHLPFIKIDMHKDKNWNCGDFYSEYIDLLERVNHYQRDKKDKNLKKDIIDFWNKYSGLMKNEPAYQNLKKRFDALKNEDIRIGAYPSFSALTDMIFYQDDR